MGLFKIFNRGIGGDEDDERTIPRTTLATADRIRNILGIRELELLPAQAARAFELASNPNSKSEEFVAIIESDEALSARVIRVANSVYFFRGKAAADIDKAVANIGLDELRSLLSATMLRSLLQTKNPSREQIWGNSVATAIASRQLAKMTTHITPGEAFLGGLLHDVGKLVMIRRGGAQYEKVFQIVSAGEKNFVEAEETVFELNHVEVGKFVAEEWVFPRNIVETIAFHHEPAPKEKKISLPTLVKIADLIAHTNKLGHQPPMRTYSKRCREQLIELLPRMNLKEGFLERFNEDLNALYEKELSLYQGENNR
jgi:HD-like signal output (HDOD) protein